MLAAGLPTLDVARFAGTSTRMIDNVYGRLVKGSEASARQRLDVFTNSGRLGQEWATP
jgi:hypothetical protein